MMWCSTIHNIQCNVVSPPMHDLAPPHLPRNNTIFQTWSLNSKGAQTFSCDSCITVKSPNLWQLISGGQNISDFLNPQQVGLPASWLVLDTFDWYSSLLLILFKSRGSAKIDRAQEFVGQVWSRTDHNLITSYNHPQSPSAVMISFLCLLSTALPVKSDPNDHNLTCYNHHESNMFLPV